MRWKVVYNHWYFTTLLFVKFPLNQFFAACRSYSIKGAAVWVGGLSQTPAISGAGGLSSVFVNSVFALFVLILDLCSDKSVCMCVVTLFLRGAWVFVCTPVLHRLSILFVPPPPQSVCILCWSTHCIYAYMLPCIIFGFSYIDEDRMLACACPRVDVACMSCTHFTFLVMFSYFSLIKELAL